MFNCGNETLTDVKDDLFYQASFWFNVATRKPETTASCHRNLTTENQSGAAQ